jgi:hypothetical protein
MLELFGIRDVRHSHMMASGGAISSLQGANPALGTVSRQPQTSATPAQKQAPFVRLSRKATQMMFDVTGVAFSGVPAVTNLKPVGGYLRRLRLEVIASGGASANSPAAADGPWNVINQIMVKDPYNQPIINVDGYGLFLIDMYSGQIAEAGAGSDISKAPSYSAVVTTTGNFTLPFYVPFELDSSGFCSLPALSAAAQAQISMTLNSQTTVYQTAPGTTVPTLEFKAFGDFWAAPVDAPDLAPPGVGSSAQWSKGTTPNSATASTNQRLNLARVGTFIHTLILVCRDSLAVRQDALPSTDLTFWVDGVPIESEDTGSRYDKMFQAFNVTRPTGVITYTFRDTTEQLVNSSDTHDLNLYTTPATFLEVGGTWGSAGTGPYKLDVYTGEMWPVGGIPYTHLAA